MAVTVVETRVPHRATYVVTMTADGSGTIQLPDYPIKSFSFTSDGVDGAGTLTWFVSNDNSNFSALGVHTSADPKNATAVTSATAAGNWAGDANDLAWKYLKFTLAGSTNPTLVVTVSVIY